MDLHKPSTVHKCNVCAKNYTRIFRKVKKKMKLTTIKECMVKFVKSYPLKIN